MGSEEENKIREEVNTRIEKERTQREEEEKQEKVEEEEEEGRLKVGREQGVRNEEMGGGSIAKRRSEVWGERREESEGFEYSVVEESEGCDDDVEIIGGSVPQTLNKIIGENVPQTLNKISGDNVPQTLNKTSYVQNWLKRGEEEQSNGFSDDDQLEESVEDIDKDIDKETTPYNTEDSFEETGVETVVEGEVGDVGTSKRKRGPSKAPRAVTDENADDVSKPAKKSRKYCCGQCEGFKRANCDACSACMDKPRNGGPNKLKQKCANRACSAQ